MGKLNKAKGYDIFGAAIIDVLNKFKDWKAIVIGDEEREKINFFHIYLLDILFDVTSNKIITIISIIIN